MEKQLKRTTAGITYTASKLYFIYFLVRPILSINSSLLYKYILFYILLILIKVEHVQKELKNPTRLQYEYICIRTRSSFVIIL